MCILVYSYLHYTHTYMYNMYIHIFICTHTYIYVCIYIYIYLYIWVYYGRRRSDLKYLLPNISTSFHGNPRTCQTCFDSQKFQTRLHLSKRSHRHSKDLSGKLIDLEI